MGFRTDVAPPASTGTTPFWPTAGPLHLILTRRLMLSPSEALFATRGFAPARDPVRQRKLEGIGETFIAGFNAALSGEALATVVATLLDRPSVMHGFAFEGAAMGAACADALPLNGSGRLAALLVHAPWHDYLLHVGVGWAMARVPWLRWTLLPRLDPLLRWLAWDGRGFHDTYFQRTPPERGRSGGGYATRAFDQGVGRALWFTCGGDPDHCVTMIASQAPARQSDLYAGLGLALAYAGGATNQELRRVRERAGRFAPALAQGAAFALEARARADNPIEASFAAGETLTGRPAEAVIGLVRAVRQQIEPAADTPALPRYERWRQAVQAGLTAGACCTPPDQP